MIKLKEDIVAMTLYIIAALIMTVLVFFYFALSGGNVDESFVIYKTVLAFGILPVIIFCIILVAIGRIIDLLNQINQKLDDR